MANYKNLENNIEKGLKEVLLDMNEEEFIEYFKQLIKNYYDVIFTFQNNHAKYYEESIKKYEFTIQAVKDLLKFEYNNLDNFENLERLKQAEDIAFKQMNTIHFMEKSYSDIIYFNTIKELHFINETLTSLIDLYKTNPSEELLTVIGNTLTNTVDIIKEIKKLPVNDKANYKDYEEEVVFKKDYSKDNNAIDLEFKVLSVPIFSLFLTEYLDKFFSILEELEKILPEDVIEDFKYNLRLSDKLNFYYNLINSGTDKEEAIEMTAYADYLREKNNTNSFLYELLDSWS